ncbi:MAG: peptidoglycan DD-metalloendopeptidase family protein [Oscillospiraceae bacterium]|nr:peptidoglycan DD-metalloendopeptidase family protein [Oscillospiraceae bacterium]
MKFFQRHQKKITAGLAIVLVIALLLSLLSTLLAGASAVTQEDIDALKEQSAQLESEISDLEDDLEDLESEINSALSQKLVIEEEINLLNEQIENTQSLIDQYDTLIAQYDQAIAEYDATIAEYDELIAQEEVNLAEAEAQEAEHYKAYCQRVRVMEEEGTVSYLAILFGAADFSDLLDRAMMISEIMEYDNALTDALEQDRLAIEAAKAAMEEYQAEQVAARAEQVAAREEQEAAKQEQESALSELNSQKSELASKTASIDALVAEMEEEQELYESQISELENKNSEIDSEIAQAQAALEAQVSAGTVTVTTQSDYIWPLPGYYTLTSLYGSRADPITGQADNHKGIDIPAPKGTSILAARGGVVITSGYHSSYGNYVVVSHGNNDSTLYAHMSSRAVSVGDTVSQGQVLGYVGSTGRSTGNHLHFEVRVSGSRCDPINMYPGLTLYYRSGGVTALLSH